MNTNGTRKKTKIFKTCPSFWQHKEQQASGASLPQSVFIQSARSSSSLSSYRPQGPVERGALGIGDKVVVIAFETLEGE